MTDTNLPANVPTKGNLPATYEAAKQALERCSRVDECKDWADKAAALASYARQAKDDSLLRHAQRIQARAIHRAGELLKQIPRGDEATRFGHVGTDMPVTRTQMATDAGLSERQKNTALRVASVPRDELEAALESDEPPTVSELAARGTVHRQSVPTSAPIPANKAQLAEAADLLRQFATFCGTCDPAGIACATTDVDMARGYVSTIDSWLDRFVINLAPDRAA